jgi:surface polysaccharide O-acyltransferase-like enzyme
MEGPMGQKRLLFIDNLRILLITLVIMVHLSVTYGGEGSWYYKEGRPDMTTVIVLTFHNATIQAFFMGFLFMIAGYFTPASYDRKRARRFLKDRLLRLGVPLLCYDFVIHPFLAYPLLQAGVMEFEGCYGRFLAMYYSEFHIGTGPLWFVETLLILALAYVVWRFLASGRTSREPHNAEVPGNMTIAIFALTLGIVTFIVRIWLPVGWAFEPLNLQLPFFPQYIVLFYIGVIAYRRDWFMRVPDAMGRFWLRIAVVFVAVLFPILFVAGGALKGAVSPFLGGLHWQCFAHALWEQFLGVAMIVALLVMFRQKFDRQGRIARAMSAGSYTVYIIHAPAIILLTLAARNINVYPLLKFAVAVVIVVPACFLLAHFISSLPLARRILQT